MGPKAWEQMRLRFDLDNRQTDCDVLCNLHGRECFFGIINELEDISLAVFSLGVLVVGEEIGKHLAIN
jgi:hypothetical protein